jgi:hypothetical protein
MMAPMAYDGGTFFDVHVPQFSHEDVGGIFFPDTMLKLGNWLQRGYVKPERVKDPVQGGPPRLRYSITEIARIAIIDTLVEGIGIKPSHASEVADFCMPFLNDAFDRHPDGELVSPARMYVTAWLNRDDGKMSSSLYYQRLDEPGFLYVEDPYRNPDAKPHRPYKGTAIHLPLTDLFNQIFLTCAQRLTNQGRGGMDKFRRPVDV